MLNVRLGGDQLYGKLLFTWLSLVMSMCIFVLFFFPRGVLDEILNLIESVSEGFPSYFYSRARAYFTCSRCGWGLFGHFYSHLSFLSSFSLSLGDGPIWTDILSQRAVKPKPTNQPTKSTGLVALENMFKVINMRGLWVKGQRMTLTLYNTNLHVLI